MRDKRGCRNNFQVGVGTPTRVRPSFSQHDYFKGGNFRTRVGLYEGLQVQVTVTYGIKKGLYDEAQSGNGPNLQFIEFTDSDRA
jgi:hypothetical protein